MATEVQDQEENWKVAEILDRRSFVFSFINGDLFKDKKIHPQVNH